jgi:GT2 family glycosyltransferase
LTISETAAGKAGMQFILIMSTLGRTDDLVRFFNSLIVQDAFDCQIYLCDQNQDRRLEPIILEWSDRLSVRVVRSETGLSRGRNAALAAALAEHHPEDAEKNCIVAFPDDDCWYSKGVLAKVAAAFMSSPETSGVTARSLNERGVPSAASSPNVKLQLTPRNLFRGSIGISYCIFLRLATVKMVGLFDETLGAGSGTPWGAGEESDYLLRAIRRGARLYYDPNIQIHHPDKAAISDASRFLAYARGHGRVLRLNGYSWATVAKDVVVALSAFIVKSVLGGHIMYTYLYRAWGYIAGYRARVPRDGRCL